MESDKAIQYLTFLGYQSIYRSQLSVKKKKFNNINTVSSQGFSGSKEANSEIYNVNEHNSVKNRIWQQSDQFGIYRHSEN